MTAVLPRTADIRKVVPADAAAVAAALAVAFADDPVFCWMLPDEDIRPVATRAFFDLVVDILAPHDEAWTTAAGVTGAGVSGAALWVPAGRAPMSDQRAEQFADELAELCAPHAERMLELIGLMDSHHPHEPHDYLWFLGVVPSGQGRGLGSALMRPVLERADEAGRPAYLEATSPRNRALYERHGFRAGTPFAVTGGPPLWPMWRDPA